MNSPTSNQTNIQGLSQTEALSRIRSEGANELPVAGQRNIQVIALEVLREPMFLLLMVAGAIYLLLGDVSDALMLLGFVFVVMGITIYQEFKTERVLEALRDLTSPRALVLRDGVERRIAGREVVRGDILILAEGDRVPADAALISSNDFAADESLLTGESVAVRKVAKEDSGEFQPPGGDDLPFVYSGTLVVQGRGMVRVLAEFVESQKSGVGRFIADQVKSWDIDVLIGRIELTVGRDLQYIRFNGAMIGGLAGLALHALEQGLKLLP